MRPHGIAAGHVGSYPAEFQRIFDGCARDYPAVAYQAYSIFAVPQLLYGFFEALGGFLSAG